MPFAPFISTNDRNLVRQVVQHIKENWHEYGPFVMAEWNISDRQTYENYMDIVGTFASELECTVATKMYNMNLSIYREIKDRPELKRVFHNHVSSQYPTARLLFTGNSDSGHYDVLVPDWRTNFQAKTTVYLKIINTLFFSFLMRI